MEIMEKEPITIEGLKKLKIELEDLKSNKRPKIVAAIARQGHGDLKEIRVSCGKEQQGHVETRILQINDLIAELMSLMLQRLKMWKSYFWIYCKC